MNTTSEVDMGDVDGMNRLIKVNLLPGYVPIEYFQSMEELLSKLETKFNEALDENYELKQRKQVLEDYLENYNETSSSKTLD